MTNSCWVVITAITPNGSATLPFVIPSTSTCLRQVEGEMNPRPGCCHSHLRAKWKSRPYLDIQSRRDDLKGLKVAQDVSPG